MPVARYTLQNHPAFGGPLSREDLHMLVARGSVARGEMCVDLATGHSHTVGELISGTRSGHRRARLHRPAYREISPDLEIPEPLRRAPRILKEERDPFGDIALANRQHAPAEDDNEDAEFLDTLSAQEEEDDLPDEEDEDATYLGTVEGTAIDEDSEEEATAEEPEEAPLPVSKYRRTPSGEVILHHDHPSWLGYTKALFLVLLQLVATALLAAIQFEYAVIAFLCATSTLITVGIARYSRDYIVTRERVELIWGIIGRSSKEARICDIRSIDVYEKGIKGLLGLGTIDFSTAANAGIEVQFKDMRKAHAVKDLVRKLQKGIDPTDD